MHWGFYECCSSPLQPPEQCQLSVSLSSLSCDLSLLILSVPLQIPSLALCLVQRENSKYPCETQIKSKRSMNQYSQLKEGPSHRLDSNKTHLSQLVLL